MKKNIRLSALLKCSSLFFILSLMPFAEVVGGDQVQAQMEKLTAGLVKGLVKGLKENVNTADIQKSFANFSANAIDGFIDGVRNRGKYAKKSNENTDPQGINRGGGGNQAGGGLGDMNGGVGGDNDDDNNGGLDIGGNDQDDVVDDDSGGQGWFESIRENFSEWLEDNTGIRLGDLSFSSMIRRVLKFSFYMMLFFWALRTVRAILNTVTKLLTSYMEFLFYMPGIADEKSGFWSMFKVPSSARAIMRAVDAKLIFDDDVRKQLYVCAEQFVKTSTTSKPLRVLLTGPPGSGKTQYAKILIRMGSQKYLMTSGSTFTRYTPQQALQELRRTFNLKNTSVFFDEADMMIGARGSRDPVIKAIRMQLMAYMGDKEKPINIVMTTNLPKGMDGAFRRRFDLIIHIPYPSLETLAKITKLYFYKNLRRMRISDELATSIVQRLKAIVAAEVSGAQIERIVDYIRAITIERRKRVTAEAIQEALNGYAAEQKSLREDYTGNDEMPPTAGEMFKKEFEHVFGLTIDAETAIEVMEELEDMVEIDITEDIVINLVKSIKEATVDKGEPLTEKTIRAQSVVYAKAQNALSNSFEEREEIMELRDILIDIVADELEVELSDEVAEAFIERLREIHGSYPTEEMLEDLVFAVQDAIEEEGEGAVMSLLEDMLEHNEEANRAHLYAPYTMLPSAKRRSLIAVV